MAANDPAKLSDDKLLDRFSFTAEQFAGSKEDEHTSYQWLPSIDWNIKFYGGHVQRVDKGWSAPLESHIGFEVLQVLDGQQITTIYGEQLELGIGDIIIIPSGIEHLNRCEYEHGLTYFCAHFHIDDPLFRIQLLRQELIYRNGTELNKRLQEIISKWLSMFKAEQAYTSTDHFQLQMVLFELCVALTRLAGQSGANDGSQPLTSTAIHYAKMIAERLKLYFNQHAASQQRSSLADLKVEALIESLGISSGYGLEVFRSVYGISPRKYLSELKLHEAKVLIQQAHMSLTDIAEQLGYSHLSHFSRQFKRWTGISPLEYRKQLLK